MSKNAASVNTLDIKVLGSYLEKHVAGFKGLISADKFSGGQSNPTFKLITESGVYVLRRQPPGKLLKSAHAVDREFRVLRALAFTDVPVAKVYHLCEDTGIIGSMFYIMEYCDGRIFWDASLPGLEKEKRKDIYMELIKVLAKLHRVDLSSAGLTDYGKPGNYFQRQYERWSKQYRKSQTQTVDAMETLMTWLKVNLPDDDGKVALVHGDYRLDNLMFCKNSPQGLALLDWELSTLGHPYADVGYLCMLLRMPDLGAVKGLRGKNLEQLGIPSEKEVQAYYCQLMGIETIKNFEFYVAFSFFRLCAILQGVAKRAHGGNASNEKASEMGALVEPLAKIALESIYDVPMSRK